jgi:hypothetical protein
MLYYFILFLSEAVDQISKVALHINENIRQHENFQKMLNIQNSFSREGAPKLLAPGKYIMSAFKTSFTVKPLCAQKLSGYYRDSNCQ